MANPFKISVFFIDFILRQIGFDVKSETMRLRERLYLGVFAPLLILSGAFLLTSERRVFGNGARIEITAVYNPVLNFGVAVSDNADFLIRF